MKTPSAYRISVRTAVPRPIAAVRTTMAIDRVPAQFGRYLDQVYEASRTDGIRLDGQNVFVYRDTPDGEAEIDFGVGAQAPFSPVGAVTFTSTPGGVVATTTHWGDYTGLGRAHSAVIRWCNENDRQLAGPRWEVYGHWSDDPAKVRTEIYYLLRPGE